MPNYSIGCSKVLRNPSIELREKLIDKLSLPNPAFTQAELYSPYQSIALPKYLYYYDWNSETKELTIPRGVKPEREMMILKDTDDERVEAPVEYPPFRLKLRPTQKEAIEAYMKRGMLTGDGLFVLPTGKGKSLLAIYLAWKLNQKALIIVHKDDLVDGWTKDIQLALGLRPKQVGLIKAGVFRIGKQITITTIQTLSRQSQRVLDDLYTLFGFICVDELHHVGAATYEYAARFYARHRIGLTATDMRNDGLGEVMYFHFGNACYRFLEQEDDEDIISAKNVLVKVQSSEIYYQPPDRYVYPNTNRIVEMVKIGDDIVALSELDYEQISQLIAERKIVRQLMDYHKVKKLISINDKFNHLVCEGIVKEYSDNKSILCFCSLKEHCRIIYGMLLDMGIPENEMQLYYGDNTTPKSIMKKRAESGEVKITIATYAIATEGTNVKRWERIFLAATFNNEKDTIQAVGRGRRKLEGKENLIVYDYGHPNVKGVSQHINTRMRVYKKLGFSFVSDEDSPKKRAFFKHGF